MSKMSRWTHKLNKKKDFDNKFVSTSACNWNKRQNKMRC